jgi:hypothetical protein
LLAVNLAHSVRELEHVCFMFACAHEPQVVVAVRAVGSAAENSSPRSRAPRQDRVVSVGMDTFFPRRAVEDWVSILHFVLFS